MQKSRKRLILLLKNPLKATFALYLILLSAGASFADTESKREYQIKAAYIYNFCKFVEWSDHSNNTGTLSICILGDDPFGSLFDPVINKTVKGRKLTLKRVSSVEDISSCQVVYISPSEKSRLPSIVASLKTSSALSISDIEGFAAAGGMIELYLDEERVKFKINLSAAQESNLKLSSMILEMATIVNRNRNE